MNQDIETNAITFGLLFAVIIGACIVVATIINTARKRRKRDARAHELFNLKTGLHPSDDIYGGDDWDDWPELEQYLEQRPGLREQYERDALKHREGSK